MTEREIKIQLEMKLEQISKEIAKGNDIYITKSADGIVVKVMEVRKV